MKTLLIALAILMAGGVLSLLLHRRFRVMKIVYAAVTLAGCLLGLFSLFPHMQHAAPAAYSCSWLQVFTLSLALDSLATIFLLPVFVISPLLALYCVHYLANPLKTWRIAVNFFFFSLLMASMILVTLANNMVTFGLAWELMSLSSFFLVIFDHEKEESQQASFIYLLFTQTGALLIFAAFGVLSGATGSFSFEQINQVPHTVKLTAFFLALAGFGSKAGVFPLHIWLPHAHPAAPSHVSALMSGVMIKMGVYGILRLYFLLDDPTPVIAQTILTLGIASGVIGVVYALGKQDLKRLLAYSSIENIGIILIGCGLGMLGISSENRIMAAYGFAGGLLHVLNHALFKSLLFMGAGAVLHGSGTRRIDQLGGLIRNMPVTGRTFLAGSVAIAGLPPFNGFISEFLIYYAAFQGLALHSSTVFLFAMAAIVALSVIGGLASACFTKAAGIVFLGEPRSDRAAKAAEAGFTMRAAMIVPALACLLIGLWPEPFIGLVFLGLRDLAPLEAITPEILGAIPANLALAARILLGLILAITLARHLLYRAKPVTYGPTWGCGFTRPTTRIQYTGASYARSMIDFHAPLVAVKTEFPGLAKIFPGPTEYTRKVEDIAEIRLHRWLIRPLLLGVGALRWIQHGHIQLYIGYIVLTIAVLLLTV